MVYIGPVLWMHCVTGHTWFISGFPGLLLFYMDILWFTVCLNVIYLCIHVYGLHLVHIYKCFVHVHLDIEYT